MQLFYKITSLLFALSLISTVTVANSHMTNPDDPGQFNHQFAQVNGIKMHYVDEGDGPAIVLLHGFPLSWYSWRNQIPALVDAGYRVIVPDQRGYGQTEAPEDVHAYDITKLTGDVVGLLNHLEIKSAVVAGWDWGTPVAWTTAQLRPDLVRGLVMVSTPYHPRGEVTHSEFWEKAFGSKGLIFYQEYFQAPGVVEKEYEDVAYVMRSTLNALSASALPNEQWRFVLKPGETMQDLMVEPKKLPAWLTPQVLDYYVEQFTMAGFTGSLNWYRNLDRNWELTSFLAGAKIQQPTLFMAGEEDPGIKWGKAAYDHMEEMVPNLYKKVLITDAAHMAPEEQPETVNALLIDFLNQL